jgi:cytochrome c2
VEQANLRGLYQGSANSVPGTTMPFSELKSEQEIADPIAYLDGFDADGYGPE